MGDTISGPTVVAAVQAEPVWFDADATVRKSIALIDEAAERGCTFIAFPETWLPGYPVFLFVGAGEGRADAWRRYVEQSPELHSPQVDAIRDAAKRHGMVVSLSLAERHASSVYISQALIDGRGEVLQHRRKLLMSRGQERHFFASGGPEGLEVVATGIGRVGSLVCSEHTRPRLQHELLRQGEQIHVAAWPSFALLPGVRQIGADTNMFLARQYAAEGGIYVVAPTMVLGAEMHAALLDEGVPPEHVTVGEGHARIYSPLGESIGTNLDPTEEGLVCAEIDLRDLRDIYDKEPLT